MKKLIIVVLAYTLWGCAAAYDPYAGVQTGNQTVTQGVQTGLTIPAKVPFPDVEVLPLKMSTVGMSRDQKTLVSRYFHTRGDWPTLSFTFFPAPKTDIATTAGWMVHRLDYELEIDASVVDWENPGEELMSVPVDLTLSATNKYHVRDAASADTVGYLETCNEVVQHNAYMMLVEKLDQIRGELDDLASQYQEYKAMN